MASVRTNQIGNNFNIAKLKLFHRGNPAAHAEGEHHETQTTPPAAFLIALLLAGSAGVASAATMAASPPDSWLGYMVDQVECAFGNQSACMALENGGSGEVHTDNPGDPSVTNK